MASGGGAASLPAPLVTATIHTPPFCKHRCTQNADTTPNKRSGAKAHVIARWRSATRAGAGPSSARRRRRRHLRRFVANIE